jgi:hypothetical protein
MTSGGDQGNPKWYTFGFEDKLIGNISNVSNVISPNNAADHIYSIHEYLRRDSDHSVSSPRRRWLDSSSLNISISHFVIAAGIFSFICLFIADKLLPPSLPDLNLLDDIIIGSLLFAFMFSSAAFLLILYKIIKYAIDLDDGSVMDVQSSGIVTLVVQSTNNGTSISPIIPYRERHDLAGANAAGLDDDSLNTPPAKVPQTIDDMQSTPKATDWEIDQPATLLAEDGELPTGVDVKIAEITLKQNKHLSRFEQGETIEDEINSEKQIESKSKIDNIIEAVSDYSSNIPITVVMNISAYPYGEPDLDRRAEKYRNHESTHPLSVGGVLDRILGSGNFIRGTPKAEQGARRLEKTDSTALFEMSVTVISLNTGEETDRAISRVQSKFQGFVSDCNVTVEVTTDTKQLTKDGPTLRRLQPATFKRASPLRSMLRPKNLAGWRERLANWHDDLPGSDGIGYHDRIAITTGDRYRNFVWDPDELAGFFIPFGGGAADRELTGDIEETTPPVAGSSDRSTVTMDDPYGSHSDD